MTKRIPSRHFVTAAQAYQATNRPNVFEIKEAAKVGQVIKLTKILVQRNGLPFAKAAQIAKRAYRLGVRCN